ncbi:hypothetical protein M1446_04945 [Candidatus Dependentiae bacterium]|nr:hypothetical protein [Candidatus Dependentiae bacterium]
MNKLKLLLIFFITFFNLQASVYKAVDNSDYDLFIKSIDEFMQISNQEQIKELKKQAEKILKQRIDLYTEKNFSKKDIARIIGGSVLTGFLFRFCKHFSQAVSIHASVLEDLNDQGDLEMATIHKFYTFFPAGVSYYTSLGGMIYGLRTIYNGFKHKDNSEKMKNAAAIKQLLDQMAS